MYLSNVISLQCKMRVEQHYIGISSNMYLKMGHVANNMLIQSIISSMSSICSELRLLLLPVTLGVCFYR